MSVELLTEHHLKLLSYKEGTQACLSLHLSKCFRGGNHMSWLKFKIFQPVYKYVNSLTGYSYNTVDTGVCKADKPPSGL